jgi:hypothetical protein
MMQSMKKERRNPLLCLLLCIMIFVAFGSDLERTSPDGMANFKAVYYGARCLLQHHDPYNESEFLRVYTAEGGRFPSDSAWSTNFRRSVLICVNLPTSLFLIAPFALLAWGPAHLLWMSLIAGSLIFSALLIWRLARKDADGVSLFLTCLLLANGELLLAGGNLAGISISLCVVAVWCFLEERFWVAGVLCLAISLALKPHDTGLVWLFLLLAGGAYRKRALQTLVVTVALSVPAAFWVTQSSPHWMMELHNNLAATSATGDISDPGPTSMSAGSFPMIIDLQTVISVFRDDPRIYNPVTYLLCVALMGLWAFTTLRSSISPKRDWLALAAIAPLTILVTYHRSYDARLLLLTVPACAILWAEGGRTRWLALGMNTLAILLTADIPLAFFFHLTSNYHWDPASLSGKMLTVLLLRPAPLILLAIALFYLWVYMRFVFDRASIAGSQRTERVPIVTARASS